MGIQDIIDRLTKNPDKFVELLTGGSIDLEVFLKDRATNWGCAIIDPESSRRTPTRLGIEQLLVNLFYRDESSYKFFSYGSLEDFLRENRLENINKTSPIIYCVIVGPDVSREDVRKGIERYNEIAAQRAKDSRGLEEIPYHGFNILGYEDIEMVAKELPDFSDFMLPPPKNDGRSITEEDIDKLSGIVPKEYLETDVPLGLWTTLGIGGVGSCLVQPQTGQEYSELVHYLRENDLLYFVVGKGSNTIYGNFPGVIIETNKINGLLGLWVGDDYYPLEGKERKEAVRFIKEKTEGLDEGAEVMIEAEAGLSLPELSRIAEECSLSGVEYVSYIPGTVGGAVVMNAGAGIYETADICRKVRIIGDDGSLRTLNRDEVEYEYRYSSLQGKGVAVYSAVLSLTKAERNKIKSEIEHFRKEGQPKGFSVGSWILRRGICGLYLAEDALVSALEGISASSGNIVVPRSKQYLSWVTAKKGRKVRTKLKVGCISSATIYDLAEVGYRLVALVRHRKPEAKLHLEARIPGFTQETGIRVKEPLQPLIEKVLSGEINPEDIKPKLEIGGEYLPESVVKR